MTWADAIGLASDILTITALLGAVWSAIVFVKKIRADQRAEHAARVSDWLKVELHKLIATSEQMLTVEEAVSALRTGSFVTDIQFTKKDLSEPNVRLQLMQLVQNGVLGQRWPDKFGITQLPHDPGGVIIAEQIKANRAVRHAFRLILDYPGHYTDKRLWEEVGRSSELSESDFYLAISDLRTKSVASKSNDGRWYSTGQNQESAA